MNILFLSIFTFASFLTLLWTWLCSFFTSADVIFHERNCVSIVYFVIHKPNCFSLVYLFNCIFCKFDFSMLFVLLFISIYGLYCVYYINVILNHIFIFINLLIESGFSFTCVYFFFCINIFDIYCVFVQEFLLYRISVTDVWRFYLCSYTCLHFLTQSVYNLSKSSAYFSVFCYCFCHYEGGFLYFIFNSMRRFFFIILIWQEG